jgi:hypothetical protein
MNKRMVCMLVVLMGIVSLVQAQAVGIYEVNDIAGQVEYKLMTKEEYAKLATELKEEAKVFSAVMAAAKKDWDADKENKIPFPSARMKMRQAKKMGSDFPTSEAAVKKLEQLELRSAEKATQDAKNKAADQKKKKLAPEDVAKESLKKTLTNNAIVDVNRRLTEKVGRDVPLSGFMASTSAKKDVKKDAAKDVKKDPEKDVKKDAEKDVKKDPEKKPAAH